MQKPSFGAQSCSCVEDKLLRSSNEDKDEGR